MSLVKIMNGCHAALLDRDDYICSIIAAKYNLDKAELSAAVREALDDDKATNKIVKMKMRARLPKPKGSGQTKKLSAYQVFYNSNKGEILLKLKNNPKEREFKNKEGVAVKILESDFLANGNPKFEHIGKKCAAEWAVLSESEKEEYKAKALIKQKELESKTEVSKTEASESETSKSTSTRKGAGRKNAANEKPAGKQEKKAPVAAAKGKGKK